LGSKGISLIKNKFIPKNKKFKSQPVVEDGKMGIDGVGLGDKSNLSIGGIGSSFLIVPFVEDFD